MIGSFRDRWEYTWVDVWEPLLLDTESPDDIFTELYRTASEFLRGIPRPTDSKYGNYVETLNSPEGAATAFKNIRGKSFRNEKSMVRFFEAVYELLDEEYGNQKLTKYYSELVKSFANRYNLRYRISQPFSLIVQIPWVYADVYKALREVNHDDQHLSELMEDFEQAFNLFIFSGRRRDLQSAIFRASNYAEGVASTMLEKPGSTMGRMCDELPIWPHDAIKDSIKCLYRFCSDYPGIRHAGNPENRLRRLDAKDTIIVSALLMAFSGYIHNGITVRKMLA